MIQEKLHFNFITLNYKTHSPNFSFETFFFYGYNNSSWKIGRRWQISVWNNVPNMPILQAFDTFLNCFFKFWAHEIIERNSFSDIYLSCIWYQLDITAKLVAVIFIVTTIWLYVESFKCFSQIIISVINGYNSSFCMKNFKRTIALLFPSEKTSTF